MAGFIYILSNPAMPNRIKVGKSTKDPRSYRMDELYTTGVPEPFKLEYYAFVENEDDLETAVFRHFYQVRPQKGREFLSIDPSVAIDAIRQLSEPHSKIKYEEVFYESPQEIEQLRIEREREKRRQEEEKRRQEEEKRRQEEYEQREIERKILEREKEQKFQEEEFKRLEQEKDKARLTELLNDKKRRNSFSFKLVSWCVYFSFIFGFWFLLIEPPIGIVILIVSIGVLYIRSRQIPLTAKDHQLLEEEEERKKQEEKRAKVEARRKRFRTLLLSLLLAIVLVLFLIGIDPNFR